ncbi:MAG: DUF305 domain-containing protein [Planctomycetes bacterium]|nr:DUF305 domain-containing protein [Planctomycetota bacterium]
MLQAILCGLAMTLAGVVWAGDMPMDATTRPWTKEDDAAFLYGMIAHHQGALDMARAVRGKSRDDQVEQWAEDILEKQAEEIARMRRLAEELALPDRGAGDAMGREMAAMVSAPVSSDPDVNFVRQMVPHHAAAIRMALPALVGSDDPRIRGLAAEIIEDQAEEIEEFRRWLDRHDPETGRR